MRSSGSSPVAIDPRSSGSSPVAIDPRSSGSSPLVAFVFGSSPVAIDPRSSGSSPLVALAGRITARKVLASSFARRQRSEFWGSLPLRMLADRALADEGARESDLLSYLLFDGDFTGQLLDMGSADAAARHDELVEFFSE